MEKKNCLKEKKNLVSKTMASTRTENAGPVIMGLNKQNGQLRGQTKAASVQSASATQGRTLGPSHSPAGAPQDGGGIKFGDDWKRNLKLPPKDNRVRTSVSPLLEPLLSPALLLHS